MLLVAGYAFKDRPIEQWYLWRLESEDEETTKAAVERLGEMGSVRAIPRLLEPDVISRYMSTNELAGRRYWPRWITWSKAPADKPSKP